MTDFTNDQTTRNTTPSHTAYSVREREGQEGYWTRVGSVWPHRDGKGFSIQLDSIPLDGRIVLRIPSENGK